MKTIGIIGYGSFGKFLADKLNTNFEVKVFSRTGKPGQSAFASFADVAKCDYLIPSIPLNAYRDYLTRLKPIIGNQTVIIDVCSVKLEPIKLIKEILPDTRLVATHPLFGPETAGDSFKGHTLVICPEMSDEQTTKDVIKLAQAAELKVMLESAEEHDKQMAKIHALTFFIARALDQLDLRPYVLDTPSYKRLLSLAELDQHHSQELFDTIQAGNPYAKAVRQKLISLLSNLDTEIDSNDMIKPTINHQHRGRIYDKIG